MRPETTPVPGSTGARVPIVRPHLGPYKEEVRRELDSILDSGQVTNGPRVRAFETEAARLCGVPHAVALSSCTSGLLLTLHAWGVRGREVIMPSFSFAATAHAAYWAGAKIVFADCDARTLNVSADDVRKKITPRTAALVAVHVFGNPCDPKPLEELAQDHGLKLLFDSAHAIGASHRSRPVGSFGHAEAFSLSPTKVLVTMEGGLVTTADADLAARLRVLRNYGNLADYQVDLPGLNARMTEVSAALGTAMARDVPQLVKARNTYADLYRRLLAGVPGLSVQETTPGGVHAYKDFTLLVDETRFGLTRDQLHERLHAAGIECKKYFDPPMHRLRAYRDAGGGPLPVTDLVARRVLSIPLHSRMDEATVREVAAAIRAAPPAGAPRR